MEPLCHLADTDRCKTKHGHESVVMETYNQLTQFSSHNQTMLIFYASSNEIPPEM